MWCGYDLRSRSFPCPCDGIKCIRVSYTNWLHRNTRVECTWFEWQQTGSICARAFRENYDLRPIFVRICSLNDRFDGVLSWIRIFAPNVNWLSEIDQFCKENRFNYFWPVERRGIYWFNWLPKNGKNAVSALARTDGGPNATTVIESKNDECGAKTKIGASFDVTWRPVTFIRWNDPATNIPRIVHDANTWTNLRGREWFGFYSIEGTANHMNRAHWTQKCSWLRALTIFWQIV